MTGALPNLIVIGAMKCGTSSLHYYLGLHPEIQMARPKELNFFVAEDGLDHRPFVSDARQLPRLGTPNWTRGASWYKSHFSPQIPVRGETSVAYTYPWYRDTAARVAALVPDAKLVFVVRDPIERMLSHYLQFSDWQQPPLSQAIADVRGPYFALSRYATMLEPFRRRFPGEQIRLIRHDHLLNRRRQALAELFRFLGVDDAFWSDRMNQVRNVSAAQGRGFRVAKELRSRKLAAPLRRLPPGTRLMLERAISSRRRPKRPQLDPEVRRRVLGALEPEIAALESHAGWDLSAWRGSPSASDERSR